MRTLTLTLFLCAAATAQAELATRVAQDAPFADVFVSDPYEDGAIWARGHRYKLGLEHGVAHFQPLFGPRAPRDYPLTLRLRSLHAGEKAATLAAKAARQSDARQLEIDHGVVQERWDLRAEGAEQSFVLTQPLGAGDLAFELAVDTSLEFAGSDATGLRFTAPGGLGDVVYSQAVAIDARGERLPLSTTFGANAIRITVPAAFAAVARYPLVVDPFLQTLPVDTTVSSTEDPKIDYDPTQGTWMVVAEEHLSATDADIVCKHYQWGTPILLLSTLYAHNTASRTTNPDVGIVAAANKFVIAWYNDSENNGCFQVRSRDANSFTFGGITVSSVGLQGDDHCRPLVGGSLTGTMYLLVMFRHNISGQDIFASLRAVTGLAFNATFLAVPTGIPSGDITTRAGVNDPWVLVWQECVGRCATLPINMLAIDAPANTILPQTAMQLANGSAHSPTVAGFGGEWLVLWEENADIVGASLASTAGVVGTSSPTINFTQFEPGTNQTLVQATPRVSYDGCRYAYCYDEDDLLGTRKPHAATAYVQGTTMVWYDGHVPLSTPHAPVFSSLAISLTTEGSAAGAGWGFVAWDSFGPGGDTDTLGAIYDARQPGPFVSIAQTGCGTPSEPQLTLRGVPAIGRTIQFVQTPPSGVPWLIGSPPANPPIPLPGCGGCMAGVMPPFELIFTSATETLIVPCNPSLVSLQYAFQSAALLQPGGCPASLLGIEFAVSDTMVLTLR